MRLFFKTFTVTTLLIFYAALNVAIAQNFPDTTYLKEVVITGTKTEIPIEKSGKSIYKLTPQAIENNAGKSISDLLNEVPGLQIDGNYSNPGSNLSYFLRGARNNQTLILIDGVPLNDPSGVTLSYDLRNIALSQVESIEVLKGGLSTLYGTGAAAGVINIILKSPPEDKLSGQIKLNAGSYETFGQQLEIGGATKRVEYLINLNNLSSKGFTAAIDETNSGTFDKDGFKKQNALLKLGIKASEKFKIDFQTGYDNFEADYDEGAFVDGNNVQTVSQLRVGVSPTFIYNKGDIRLNVVFNSNERKFESSFPQEYKGGNLQLDLVHQHNFSENVKGLFGLNLQEMGYEELSIPDFEKVKYSTFDPYASIIYSNDGTNIHAGIRYNLHNEYGGKFVYNVNPSYTFGHDKEKQFKLFASYSTAYVTPSLYQYYSIYGNPELKPEETANIDLGFGVILGSKINFNFAFYNRDETNPIDFESLYDDMGNWIGGLYVNTVSERKVYGLEFDATWKIIDNITLTGHYTFAESDDEESFYRIPKHKYGGNLSWSPGNNLNLSLKYLYTTERTIFDWISFSELHLKSFGIFDAFVSYDFLKDKLKVKGAVNNLFDADFIGVYGFTNRGRNYDISLAYRF